MRYAIVPRVLLHLLTQPTAPADPVPASNTDLRQTPTEKRLIAAASPLRGGPRHRFRRPMRYATGLPAPVLAAA
ncbi:hypothetical protein GCM10010441_44620 [Kitasatospora paracochleata]|uniref:Secreted protein n=1 Tax=Kitasatospora paracochleata TaxID=58354 RepID=A0ABT1JAE4_9ACTN|nr:hypothetical protein [Kitasatospora paracochleata]MCP2314038.1 hypothetical protein [Kitasatospora paracochleata]